MSEPNATAPAVTHPGKSLIIALGSISVISGLLVVLAFQLTLPRITLNQQKAIEKAVFTVLPEATVKRNFLLDDAGLHPVSDADFASANVFAGYDAQGRLTGVAMEGSARGYQDIVRVLYGYSLESQCIIGFTVLQSTETPGLGDKVSHDPAFLANFECLDARLTADGSAVANPIVTVKNGRKTQRWQIDAISGATITSTAIGTGLRESTNRMLPLLMRHRAALDTPAN